MIVACITILFCVPSTQASVLERAQGFASGPELTYGRAGRTSADRLAAAAPIQVPTGIPKNRVLLFPNGSKLLRQTKPLEGVRRNTGLVAKDDLRADGERHIEFVVGDIETVRVKPKSRIILTKLPPEDPKPNEKYSTFIKIEQGTLLVRGSEAFRSARFQIQTPVANTGARGTSFVVRITGERMFLMVAEGLAEIQSPTNPAQRLIVRHGQKVDFQGPVPPFAEPITPSDLALYQELLSLPGSARDTDFRNDIADADISELYVKRWDPLGRWAALPPLAPDSYGSEWRPDLLNVARNEVVKGVDGSVRNQVVTVDEEAVRRTLEPGFILMALSKDGQTVYASHPQKGLWAFDFLKPTPGRVVSKRPLANVQPSPNGQRIVASVGFEVRAGLAVPRRLEWIVLDTASGAEKSLAKYDQPTNVRARWFDGGKRLLCVAGEGSSTRWYDGDSTPPKLIHTGRGELSPKTGAWLYSPGFETALAQEYTVVRTADGQKWTGQIPKPLSTRVGGRWSPGDELYLGSAEKALRMTPPPTLVPNPPSASLYRSAPLAFSPDGRFYCFVEFWTDRLIVGDSARPDRIFDTGVILYHDIELSWLPVGDTIHYQRTSRLADNWTRRDIAGLVELGAVRLTEAKRQTFTANPRDDAVTPLGPPELNLDVKVLSAAGSASGTSKGPTMRGFVWSASRGVELLDPPQGSWSAALAINSQGLVLGTAGTPSGSRTFLYQPGTGYTFPPKSLTSGYQVLSDNGLLLSDLQKGDSRRAAFFNTKTGTVTELNKSAEPSESHFINTKGSILYSIGTPPKLQWFVFDEGRSRAIPLKAGFEVSSFGSSLADDGTAYLFGMLDGDTSVFVQPPKGEGFFMENRDRLPIFGVAGVLDNGDIVIRSLGTILLKRGDRCLDLRKMLDLGKLTRGGTASMGTDELFCYSTRGTQLVCRVILDGATISVLIDIKNARIWDLASTLEPFD